MRRIESKRADALLRHHERHHLAVKNAIVEANYGVHSNRDQLSRSRFEDCGPERTTCCALDVRPRDSDGDAHTIVVPLVRAAKVNDLVDPGWVLYLDNGMIHRKGKITRSKTVLDTRPYARQDW